MIPYRNPLLVSCFRKPPRQTTRRHAQEYAYYLPVNLHISTELHGHQQSKFLPEHCHIHARKSFTSSQNMPIYGVVVLSLKDTGYGLTTGGYIRTQAFASLFQPHLRVFVSYLYIV
jgi:hypothetical protein